MGYLDKIECPYCGVDFEVSTDDGQHYNDGESESDYCPLCEKQIMIYSSCGWYREASKADCLNDIAEHDWSEWSKHHPVEDFTKFYATRYCRVCDKQEQAKLEVTESEDDQRRIKMYRDVEA
ncbi:hypothetical protein [Rhodococcoides fascians]|uniref:hypothetical protein n=1 Tax=Rhodococcoides fascians TaxID=1828 RepID=UPI001D251B5B|nr:hypothetical protein [Rhodococcus fascians]CAH0190535.1 hypothetical protein SRABI91_01662 [Rhodococcus fascians]